jgi:hypothetical protein
MVSHIHNGTIILWAFNFTINPDLKKYGRGFNVHELSASRKTDDYTRQ